MIIAFDYSMSTPCMCVSYKKGWHHSQLYFLTDTKKYASHWLVDGASITGVEHEEWKTAEQRFAFISGFFINTLDGLAISKDVPVYIEDYSIGSKGKVFHIAENTGILKHRLWLRGHDIHYVAPTVIKKYATGKGTAKKQQMYASFVHLTGMPLATVMGANSNNIGSPVADVVDAFFLSQYAYPPER